jgi:hypothetical protein
MYLDLLGVLCLITHQDVAWALQEVPDIVVPSTTHNRSLSPVALQTPSTSRCCRHFTQPTSTIAAPYERTGPINTDSNAQRIR